MRGLPKLEELHLHSNWLENLDMGVFFALPKLRVLNVSNNNLYDIKRTIFNAPNDRVPLELLDYSSNNVKVLEDSVFASSATCGRSICGSTRSTRSTRGPFWVYVPSNPFS